jgi:hypothetical protein
MILLAFQLSIPDSADDSERDYSQQEQHRHRKKYSGEQDCAFDKMTS